MRLHGSTHRGAYHTGQASSADHGFSLRSLTVSEQGYTFVDFTTSRKQGISDWLSEGPISISSGASRGMATPISFGGSNMTRTGQSRHVAQTKKNTRSSYVARIAAMRHLWTEAVQSSEITACIIGLVPLVTRSTVAPRSYLSFRDLSLSAKCLSYLHTARLMSLHTQPEMIFG